jgi:two-component system, NarL family, sensor kinase
MDTTETRIYTAFLIGSLVVGALLFYFALRIVRLHKKHLAVLSNTYMYEVELLEHERNRIANDLHDDLGPLVSIACTLIQNSTGASEDDQLFLRKAEQALQELNEKFRETARNLSTDVLHANGLQYSIERFLNRCKLVSKIDFELKCKLEFQPNSRFGLQVYRIVQELVHNAMKHSDAGKVQLKLVIKNNQLYLFYEDDGIGLPTGTVTEGMGIKGMRSRVMMLNGFMDVQDRKQGGTRFYFSLPITSKDA